MQNRKRCTLLISVIVVGIFALSPSFSSFMNTVVINNTGTISLSKITANSGSPVDIQNAVNAVVAAGGGTVYIPVGNWTFNPPVNGTGVTIPYTNVPISIIGAGIDLTILTETVNPGADLSWMFSRKWNAQNYNASAVRISGITFAGFVLNETFTQNIAITLDCTKDFRIDHCKFTNFVNTAINVDANTGGTYRLAITGVIDHCIIDDPYKDWVPSVGGTWGYGILVSGDHHSYWQNLSNLLGQYGNPNVTSEVYIENCNFSRCRHAITENEDGFYVVRYCTFSEPRPKNFAIIDVHGFNHGRGLEAYDNTVNGAAGYGGSVAFGIRGGGGCIFNNNIIGCSVGIWLLKESGGDPPYSVNDIYIWGNTQTSGTPFQSDSFYTQNVDYFLYARPGYTPYPYPHPLTLQTTP